MELNPHFRVDERPGGAGPSVVVIGGGASGVLMALHLLRSSGTVRVMLVEKSDLLGCGIAYRTSDPGHLLNTRVSSMSAYADHRDHFLAWLRAAVDPSACPFSFVPRGTYGQYLANTLEIAEGATRLTCVRGEAVRLSLMHSGLQVQLGDGQVLSADKVVLATGHALPEADAESGISVPWGDSSLPHRDADVLLIGTGLTMVDQVMTLLDAGHRGRIEAISRRGLLPLPHADAPPVTISPDDLPLGRRVTDLMLWLRNRAAEVEAEGGNWRSVVDGLRPHVQKLWQAMDLDARARFLRHACVWWEVHRHRLPPSSAWRIEAARSEGRLVLRRAAFLGAKRSSDNTISVRLLPTGSTMEETQTVHHLIDCRGIRRDPERNAAPVVRQMLSDGLAKVDPLRLGILVDDSARVLRPDGTVLQGVFAIGPVSRSAFWEITAIPDIRVQAAWLSATLSNPYPGLR